MTSQKVFFVLILLIALLYLGIWAYLSWRTVKQEASDAQINFSGGQLPNPLPNGFTPGVNATGNWQGKIFDQANQKGLNRFKDGERAPFKIYTSTGMRDKNLQVMRIDYNVAGNPRYLRHLVDELVEVRPGQYQGKIMLRWWFGTSFTLGYFALETAR